MKKRILYIIWLVLVPLGGFAQTEEEEEKKEGYIRMFVTEFEGELVGTGEMNEILITAPRPSAKEMRSAQKKLERYDKVRWTVHKVYPYAVGIADLLKKVEKETAALPANEQKDYLEAKQKLLFKEYKEDIENMTNTQGKTLIKLIHRQTGKNAYSLIKDTKNGATAFFYNGVGSLFGLSLKQEFDPEDDALINDFAYELDKGCYNIFWKQENYRFDVKKL